MRPHEPVNQYGVPGRDAGVYPEIISGGFRARCSCGWSVFRKRRHAAEDQLREHLTAAYRTARAQRNRAGD